MNNYMKFFIVYGIGFLFAVAISFLLYLINDSFILASYPAGALVGFVTALIWSKWVVK